MTIEDLIDKGVTVRLHNILRYSFEGVDPSEIKKADFTRVRNAGKKSWEELCRLVNNHNPNDEIRPLLTVDIGYQSNILIFRKDVEIHIGERSTTIDKNKFKEILELINK